jgi:hypothetical protein
VMPGAISVPTTVPTTTTAPAQTYPYLLD